MKKALASVVVIVFAGLLCTSLLTIFTGSFETTHHSDRPYIGYSYYLSY